MWLKYSDSTILTGEQWDRDQDDDLGWYQKPRGFWITDDSPDDCWRKWCVSEQFNLENLTHKHEVVLDETDILILRTLAALARFNDEFLVEKWWGPTGHPRKYRNICMDWPAVAARYSGLIITPYQWSRRLDLSYSWYNPWDCASGCIWKARAILEIKLIEIDMEVATLREAA
jgi:hypothetical protein